jgi:hypothetical protein
MVGVGLRDDADKSFVAGNVYALACLIVKHVVGLSNARDFSNDFPCISVEHNYLCGFAGSDEKSMMHLIQRQRGPQIPAVV